MTSRKLDLVVEKINEQNQLDEDQILKETQVNSRLVNIWNKNRENLHYKNDFRERRFQDWIKLLQQKNKEVILLILR